MKLQGKAAKVYDSNSGSDFIRVNSSRPCKICNSKKECRESKSTGIVFCHYGNEFSNVPHGYKYCGIDKKAGFKMFRDTTRNNHNYNRPTPKGTVVNTRTNSPTAKPKGGQRTKLEKFNEMGEEWIPLGEKPTVSKFLSESLGIPHDWFFTGPNLYYWIDRKLKRDYHLDFLAWNECNGYGDIVARKTRSPYTGEKRGCLSTGIVYARNWADHDGPICIPEGLTDLLVINGLGISCASRPSNMDGGKHLIDLIRSEGTPIDRKIFVVAENDRKEDGRWPGREGAIKIAQEIANARGCSTWIVFPGFAKDTRDWFRKQWAELHDANRAYTVADNFLPDPSWNLRGKLLAEFAATSIEVKPIGPPAKLTKEQIRRDRETAAMIAAESLDRQEKEDAGVKGITISETAITESPKFDQALFDETFNNLLNVDQPTPTTPTPELTTPSTTPMPATPISPTPCCKPRHHYQCLKPWRNVGHRRNERGNGEAIILDHECSKLDCEGCAQNIRDRWNDTFPRRLGDWADANKDESGISKPVHYYEANLSKEDWKNILYPALRKNKGQFFRIDLGDRQIYCSTNAPPPTITTTYVESISPKTASDRLVAIITAIGIPKKKHFFSSRKWKLIGDDKPKSSTKWTWEEGLPVSEWNFEFILRRYGPNVHHCGERGTYHKWSASVLEFDPSVDVRHIATRELWSGEAEICDPDERTPMKDLKFKYRWTDPQKLAHMKKWWFTGKPKESGPEEDLPSPTAPLPEPPPVTPLPTGPIPY